MPRYFFDMHDGRFIPDDEGVVLDGLDAACREVWRTLPMMMADRELGDGSACELRMAVRDEGGRTVFRATLTLGIERP
jgi:hypothetical protein